MDRFRNVTIRFAKTRHYLQLVVCVWWNVQYFENYRSLRDLKIYNFRNIVHFLKRRLLQICEFVNRGRVEVHGPIISSHLDRTNFNKGFIISNSTKILSFGQCHIGRTKHLVSLHSLWTQTYISTRADVFAHRLFIAQFWYILLTSRLKVPGDARLKYMYILRLLSDYYCFPWTSRSFPDSACNHSKFLSLVPKRKCSLLLLM